MLNVLEIVREKKNGVVISNVMEFLETLGSSYSYGYR